MPRRTRCRMTQMEGDGAAGLPPRDPTPREQEPADEEMEETSESGEDALSDSGTDLSDIGMPHINTLSRAHSHYRTRGDWSDPTATLPEAPATVGTGAIARALRCETTPFARCVAVPALTGDRHDAHTQMSRRTTESRRW
jgi:hypothetical protein